MSRNIRPSYIREDQGDISERTAPFLVSREFSEEKSEYGKRKTRRYPYQPENAEDSLAFHAKRCSVLIVAGLVSGVRYVVIKAENLYESLKRYCAKSSKLKKVKNACGKAHRAIKKQLQTPSSLYDYTLSPTSEGASSLCFSAEELDQSSESFSERWVKNKNTACHARLHIRWVPDVHSDDGSSHSDNLSFRELVRTIQRAKFQVEQPASCKQEPKIIGILDYKPEAKIDSVLKDEKEKLLHNKAPEDDKKVSKDDTDIPKDDKGIPEDEQGKSEDDKGRTKDTNKNDTGLEAKSNTIDHPQ